MNNERPKIVLASGKGAIIEVAYERMKKAYDLKCGQSFRITKGGWPEGIFQRIAEDLTNEGFSIEVVEKETYFLIVR